MMCNNDVHLAYRDSEFVICPFCNEVEVNKPEKNKNKKTKENKNG